MAYFAIFFFVGNWMAMTPHLVQRFARPRITILLVVPAIAFGVASVAYPEALHYLVLGAPFSVIGALVLVGIYSATARGGPVRRVLESLGQSSIVFYVSHFPVMALLSLSPLSAAGPLALAIVNLAAALAVGALLARFKRTPPVCWLFQAPGALTSGVTALLAVPQKWFPAAERSDGTPSTSMAETTRQA
jgi:peptidoglycan/LPS O-acetylase OafA/YrhL